MESIDQTQLVVGLPATGKSTFLAALWHLAQYADTNTQLAIANLGDNDEHLNELCRAWLTCAEVERSKGTNNVVVEMQLTTRSEPLIRTNLYFPDLAGEIYEMQWNSRQCEKDYAELAKNSNGVLLFVHPQRIFEPTRMESFLGLMDDQQSGDEVVGGVQARDPSRDPTSTILVELLQFIHKLSVVESFRVAVIVSAWDLVAQQHPGMMPESWVRERLPLLQQYLDSNREALPSKIYGVSAQGGDYAASKNDLLRMVDATNRIKIVAADYSGKDLTRIVHWVVSGG